MTPSRFACFRVSTSFVASTAPHGWERAATTTRSISNCVRHGLAASCTMTQSSAAAMSSSRIRASAFNTVCARCAPPGLTASSFGCSNGCACHHGSPSRMPTMTPSTESLPAQAKQRVIQHPALSKWQVLLGPVRHHPLADSGGRNDRPDFFRFAHARADLCLCFWPGGG